MLSETTAMEVVRFNDEKASRFLSPTVSKVFLTCSLFFLTVFLMATAVTFHVKRIIEPAILTILGWIFAWPILVFELADLRFFGFDLDLVGLILNFAWLYFLACMAIFLAKKDLSKNKP